MLSAFLLFFVNITCHIFKFVCSMACHLAEKRLGFHFAWFKGFGAGWSILLTICKVAPFSNLSQYSHSKDVIQCIIFTVIWRVILYIHEIFFWDIQPFGRWSCSWSRLCICLHVFICHIYLIGVIHCTQEYFTPLTLACLTPGQEEVVTLFFLHISVHTF